MVVKKYMHKLLTKFSIGVGASLVGLALCTGIVFAASGYTLFGNAVPVSPGNASNGAINLTSTCPGGSGVCFGNNTFTYSGINFSVPTGATLGNLGTLSTDYNVTAGDCGGGAPRFVINYDKNQNTNIVVYIGPTPNFTGCTPNTWQNTGNFIGSSDLRFDTSQLGGTFYDTYANAVSISSSHTISGISLVVDGGWAVAGNTQTVLIDNTTVGGNTYTYEPHTKADCLNGGWKTLTDANGHSFKNQGDCVSYFATGGKNPGAGQ
jgi:hypothetical protein